MMYTFASEQLACHPPVPHRLEDLGIPEALVTDLFLRRTLIEGSTTITLLSEHLKVSPAIVDTVFRSLREQKLLDVKGMVGDDYHFSLTSAGRSLAGERLRLSHYASAAPVSLRDYQEVTRAQSAKVEVNRKILRQAFHDLVISDRILNEIGPAIISQNSIFLYGPSGNGKTSIAERLHRIYRDTVVLPYAVEVDGQVISLYDPVLHEPINPQPWDIDPRWIACKRPCVVVGGELVSTMLELRLDEATGIYAAPLQMKANNGIFVIDDFGRQMMSPRELLNRWIVPLDRRVDYLTLQYGVKFPIPFDLMVIFSTNLDPRDLADDAFFRRIQNKIYIDPVHPAIFDEIFERVAAARKIPHDRAVIEYCRSQCLALGGSELRACFPNDICKVLQSICAFEGIPVQMTKELVDRALTIYFAPMD